MTVSLLKPQKTGFILVDPQTKLLNVMRREQTVVDNIIRLLHLANLFNLLVIATEQYARLLGPILPNIATQLPESSLIKKMNFGASACRKRVIPLTGKSVSSRCESPA